MNVRIEGSEDGSGLNQKKMSLEYERRRKLETQENEFRLVYEKQRETVKRIQKIGLVFPPDPVMDAIFSEDPKRQAEVTHVDYLAVMNQEDTRERIDDHLHRMYPLEIRNYGERKFDLLLNECNDRRLLFKLINREITLDQFIVRVSSDTGGITYLCKDDLIQQGISKEFFHEIDFRNDFSGVQRQFVNHLQNTQGMIVKTPRENLGPDVSSALKTEEYRRYQKVQTSDKNKWRTDRRCLKSIFTIVPDNIHARKKNHDTDKLQVFSKIKRFPYDREVTEDAYASFKPFNNNLDNNQYQIADQSLKNVKSSEKMNWFQLSKKARRNSCDMDLRQSAKNSLINENGHGSIQENPETVRSKPQGQELSHSPKLSPKSSGQQSKQQSKRQVSKSLQKQNKQPAQKEGVEKHLRHSLLFIRKLLNEQEEEGMVLYDKSTRINMMYQKELMQYLDTQKKEKLIQQGLREKGQLETVHIIRGELKKKKKGVRQILQEAGVIKETSNLNVTEFMKMKKLIEDDPDNPENQEQQKLTHDQMKQKLELMIIECEERFKRENFRLLQRKKSDPHEYLRIDCRRQPDAVILDEQSDMQILQQVTLPLDKNRESNTPAYVYDSQRELNTIQSVLQPLDDFNNKLLDESEEDKDMELDQHSSAGQTQMKGVGMQGSPELIKIENLPTIPANSNTGDKLLKGQTILNINADLPIDTLEQSIGVTREKNFGSQSATPGGSESVTNNNTAQRPFAKTQRLIEMESNPSSMRNTYRQNKQVVPQKVMFATSQPITTTNQSKPMPMIRIVSASCKKRPPPGSVVNDGFGNSFDRVRCKSGDKKQHVAESRNFGQGKVATQVRYPEQVLLQKVPIELHPEQKVALKKLNTGVRPSSVNPVAKRAAEIRNQSDVGGNYKNFVARRKSAPANNRKVQREAATITKTLEEQQLSSNVSTQVPGTAAGYRIGIQKNSIQATATKYANASRTSRGQRSLRVTQINTQPSNMTKTSRMSRGRKNWSRGRSKNASVTDKKTHDVASQNIEPAKENRKIQSLMEQIQFKAPSSTKNQQEETNQEKVQEGKVPSRENLSNLQKTKISKEQVQRIIGPTSGLFLDPFLPKPTLGFQTQKYSSSQNDSSVMNQNIGPSSLKNSTQPQNQHKFIQYIESLGIFVNKRSNTALTNQATQDCLDSQPNTNNQLFKNRENIQKVKKGDKKSKDAAINLSGESLHDNTSLKQNSEGKFDLKINMKSPNFSPINRNLIGDYQINGEIEVHQTAHLTSENVGDSKQISIEQMTYDTQKEQKNIENDISAPADNNTRYQIIVMKSPMVHQLGQNSNNAVSLMTLPMMSANKQERQVEEDAQGDQSQNFKYLNLVLQNQNSEVEGSQTREQPQSGIPKKQILLQKTSDYAKQYSEKNLGKARVTELNQEKPAFVSYGFSNDLLSSPDKKDDEQAQSIPLEDFATQLNPQHPEASRQFVSFIQDSNRVQMIKSDPGQNEGSASRTRVLIEKNMHLQSPSPNELSHDLISVQERTVKVSNQDTATVFNSGSQDRNESVDKINFKPQYLQQNSRQIVNVQDQLTDQSAQQILSEGYQNLGQSALSVDQNNFIFVNNQAQGLGYPSALTSQGQSLQKLIRYPVDVQDYRQQSDPSDPNGKVSSMQEHESMGTPMLMMNSLYAPKHPQTSQYEENIKVRSIMDTSTTVAFQNQIGSVASGGDLHRYEAPSNITMKVNVFSMSKNNQSREKPNQMTAMSNAEAPQQRRHFNAKDSFLNRVYDRKEKQPHLGGKPINTNFFRELEVTPTSGMVKRIGQVQGHLQRQQTQRDDKGQQYNEEPGILSSDNQSTLKPEQIFTPAIEFETSENPQSILNSPKEEQLDYSTNKTVISKVYREAYIGRSRKMSNIKSLSIVRKNRAADFKHYLKQTVQQLGNQPHKRQSKAVGVDPRPYEGSQKYEMMDITRLKQLAFLNNEDTYEKDERIATAERDKSHNQTMSNRSFQRYQDLYITPQMPSGTTIASKKQISHKQNSNNNLDQNFLNDMAHSKKKHRSLLANRAEISSGKRNSDLAEFQMMQQQMSSTYAKNNKKRTTFPQNDSLKDINMRGSANQTNPYTIDQDQILMDPEEMENVNEPQSLSNEQQVAVKSLNATESLDQEELLGDRGSQLKQEVE